MAIFLGILKSNVWDWIPTHLLYISSLLFDSSFFLIQLSSSAGREDPRFGPFGMFDVRSTKLCAVEESEGENISPILGDLPSTWELRLISQELAMKWDWSTYLADYGQPNCKYLRVNPVTALTLLENHDKRMKDTSRKNNMFAQFRKNERDKQKLIDTVAKQLRGLISSHHS
ncbi:hypothetical protein P7K49_029191 [Saguinus oedipus]|uniref:Exocyst complex component 6 n=1 Tax=Saguinus oedipus TaxID=9490 RepID=A0ABQ9U8J3_SAGOE|nr:hypothetical protein P7K49_029191 [Saguinus oedipus]